MLRISTPLLLAVTAVVAISIANVPTVSMGADERTATDLLPGSCIAVVEIHDPSNVLDTLLEHPVWKRGLEHDAYRQAIQDPKYLFFQAVVGHIEARIGMSWRESYNAVLGGGMLSNYNRLINK